MKVYVAMWNDRHTDPEPYLFADKDLAIEFARQSAKESMSRHYPDDYKETFPKGWLICVTYSCEGDCIWVIEKELHTETGYNKDKQY